MWDFEPSVRIDPDDVLEYVRDNKEWFLDKLGEDDYVYKNRMQRMAKYLHNLCNEDWDFLRKVRDGISNLSDKEIVEKCTKLYDEIENIKKYLEAYTKD